MTRLIDSSQALVASKVMGNSLLTPDEAADRLRQSRVTLFPVVRRGDIEALVVHKRKYFHYSDVDMLFTRRLKTGKIQSDEDGQQNHRPQSNMSGASHKPP